MARTSFVPAMFVVWLLLVMGAPASAHAVLIRTAPAAGVQLERAPQSVTLTFGEAVETSLGSLRVLDAAGTLHSTGPVRHPDGDATRVSVRLENMARGRYVAAWQVVSADSHLVNGAFAFGVGVPAGDAPALAEENGAALFLPFLHFAILAGVLLGTGLPIGALTIGRSAPRPPSFVEFGAWIVLAFAAFADIAFRADLAGGTFAAAIATRVGVLRLITIGAALAGVMALAGKRRRLPLLALAAGVSTLSLSLAGHAADGPFAVAGIGADTLHLLAAAGWIGVLAYGTLLEDAPELRGISQIAAGAVTVLVVTGVAQTARNVGSFDALIATAYGQIIVLKIVLLLALLGIALSARRVLARGSLAIAGRIKAELWVLTLVIVCTAVLVESPLPRDAAPAHSVAATLTVRDIAVHVTATAVDARHWNVRVDANAPLDEAGAAVEDVRRHVGPLTVPLTPTARNSFSGTATLPFAGEWRLLISVRSGPFDEAHRTLALPETSP